MDNFLCLPDPWSLNVHKFLLDLLGIKPYNNYSVLNSTFIAGEGQDSKAGAAIPDKPDPDI